MLQSLPKRPHSMSFQNIQSISKQTQVQSNMFLMQIEDPSSSESDGSKPKSTSKNQCHQYDIDFEPKIEESKGYLGLKIFQCARKNIENIFGKCSFSGKSLYTLKKFSDKKINEINDIDKISVEGIKYSIRIRWIKEIEFNQDSAQNKDRTVANYKKGNQVTQVIHIILKDLVRQEGFQQIGRNSEFFNLKEKKEVRTKDIDGNYQGTVQVYQGIKFGTYPTQDKLYLMVDQVNRLLSKETAYQYLKSLPEEDWTKIVGQSVITEYYQNMTYKIDRIDRTQTPLSTFKRKKTNEKITYQKYYKEDYSLSIKDLNQPLLVHLRNYREPNTNIKKTEEIYLVPELCKIMGTTEEQRSNYQNMKAISNHTRLEPLEKFENSIKNCKILANLAKQSHINIDHTKNKIDAIILNPPKIYFGENKSLFPEKRNFDMRAPTYQLVQFNDWSIIYDVRDEAHVDQFVENLLKACLAYNIKVKKPGYFQVDSNRPNDWIKVLDKDFKKNDLPQFVVTFGNFKSNFYQDMKKFLTKTVGIESQHVTPRALQKNTMSVVSKIALQIGSKLGSQIWKVQIPNGLCTHTMVIGIETSMKQVKKSQVVGVVASVNKDFTKYYSEVEIRQDNACTLPALSKIIKKAIESYVQNTKNLPEEIIIYRQGLGEGQIQQSLQLEINAVKNGFNLYNNDYNPRFAFFQVNRKIGQKFYAFGPKQVQNPTSGTIVAQEVVQNNFEFFMCAQNCNSGVCTPTKYTCLHNDTKLNEQNFYQLTYFQTFNYYNWQGPVRVPAVMKYAEKLAKFTSDVLQDKASKELVNSFYYL